MGKQIITIVDAPEISLAENEKAWEALQKFYRSLGWNEDDILDPRKVHTTKDVYKSLYDVMYEKCGDSVCVGMLMTSRGPGTDDYVRPGKVYLLEGWTTPAKSEGGETNGN